MPGAAPRAFLDRVHRLAKTNIAQLPAELDQFAGQPARALSLLDMGARLRDALGGDGAGGLEAKEGAVEHVAGPVAGIVLMLAAAGRFAAVAELPAQCPGRKSPMAASWLRC